MTFQTLFRQATGYTPFAYQRRLANACQLPAAIQVPTGSGKTAAAVLTWLWRRRYHQDLEVRTATPRRLVYCLPMRVLVEQTYRAVDGWLRNLDLSDEVGLYLLLGGRPQGRDDWVLEPEKDAVLVGTQDLLVSRALNRGYGISRFRWPVEFGLINSDCLWVMDEVQLMGVARRTTAQLDGLAARFGTAAPRTSLWMSATLRPDWLVSIDRPDAGDVATLMADDRADDLHRRLTATKTVRHVPVEGDLRALAELILERHRPKHLTLVVVNTVRTARDLHKVVARRHPKALLLHSLFRPGDRRQRLAEVEKAADVGGIVVSTQVVEAGVDLSAAVLFMEAAPWASVVQRLGRCNRYGELVDAEAWWWQPARPAPYEEEEIALASETLRSLEGESASPDLLEKIPFADRAQPWQTLRARDLVELFDTAPDLSGNDLDVSRFVRETDDTDLQAFWRAVPKGTQPADDEPEPTPEELCPVPVHDLRAALKKGRGAWRFDPLRERRKWVPLAERELRPGMIVMLDAAEGGYAPERGWDPAVRTPVDPIHPAAATPPETTGGEADNIGKKRPLALETHLLDVARTSVEILNAIQGLDLPRGARDAVERAALLHDVGKAHPIFQATMRKGLGDHAVEDGVLIAKTPGRGAHERPHFRHELASALAVLANPHLLDDLAEPDLTLYLIASHHGRARLAFRSLPGEQEPPLGDGAPRRFALGVWDGDEVPDVSAGALLLKATRLDLSPMEMGRSADGHPSWAARAITLRDRADLGPFRLAYLEALVRIADWRASAQEEAADD
jgi:CRISPR-associated endonuclease/helicase Cas3